jgi:hypothetical protein
MCIVSQATLNDSEFEREQAQMMLQEHEGEGLMLPPIEQPRLATQQPDVTNQQADMIDRTLLNGWYVYICWLLNGCYQLLK